MTRVKTQYSNLNRILLLSIGLWPYQQSKFTRLQFIFFYAVLASGIIFQLTSFITLNCTWDLVIKVLSSVSFFVMIIIQYNAFCLNIKVVKNLLMELQHIHNKLEDENEIAIVEKYNRVSKYYTIGITTVGISGMFILVVAQILQLNTNDVDLSMNASQPCDLFITEYFIDQKKYFYLILLHFNAIIYIGGSVMMGIGTLLITYLEHTCGMFRIASYRIERAINIDVLQDVTLKNKILMTEGIICAVDIHRQAMKLSKHLLSEFEIMIFNFTGCVVICFSLNLFQFFQVASFENNVEQFIVPLVFASTSILYMFLANYIGQNVIDHNNHIFITAYKVQWYKTPLHIQRMILFLLQRNIKEFSLNIGGIFDASIEGFATLVKASVSYFTLIHSTWS